MLLLCLCALSRRHLPFVFLQFLNIGMERQFKKYIQNLNEFAYDLIEKRLKVISSTDSSRTKRHFSMSFIPCHGTVRVQMQQDDIRKYPDLVSRFIAQANEKGEPMT